MLPSRMAVFSGKLANGLAGNDYSEEGCVWHILFEMHGEQA